MSLGLSMYDCCGYEAPCSITITVWGCGVNLAGYSVGIWYGPLVGEDPVETKETDADGQVTFDLPGSGTYSFFVTSPVGGAFLGYELDGLVVLCPGHMAYLIDLHPAEGEGCTDCGPVPLPNGLTLSGWYSGTPPTSTNGSDFILDFPLVDCADPPCDTNPEFAVHTTRVFFHLICRDGLFSLQIWWFVRFRNPAGEEDAGVGEVLYTHCPYPWDDAHPIDIVAGTVLSACVEVPASFVAASGPFAATFEGGGVECGTATAVADPFKALLCRDGYPTISVTAT